MPFFSNSHGQRFQSGIGGTYPVNNLDPQNDVEDDSPGDDTPEPSQEDIDDINERNPAYNDARDNHYERGR